MAGAASAHQAATASHEQNSQQRAGRRRRTSADPQRAQQGATAAAAPAALDSLSRLQQLADASPQVAKLRRLQALADGQFAPVAQLAGGPEEEDLVQGKFASTELQPQLQQAPCANNTGLPDQLSDRDTFLPMPAQNLDGRLSLPTIRKRCVAERSPAQRFEKPNRTGLPDALKSGVEALSGLSLDQVRVHRNSPKPAQLNAHAYAQGSDIHLAPGQEKHLPHEAWHIVQQAQGRVKPTAQLKGIALNDDSALEREADVMGQAALRPTVSRSQAPLFPPRSSPRVAPVQALFYFRSSGGETRLADVDLVVSLLQESGYVPENLPVVRRHHPAKRSTHRPATRACACRSYVCQCGDDFRDEFDPVSRHEPQCGSRQQLKHAEGGERSVGQQCKLSPGQCERGGPRPHFCQHVGRRRQLYS